MILRQHNGWELWSGVHPASIGCVAEGREMCEHKYHLVNEDRTQIESFDDWKKADTRFCEESGAETFNPIKSK